MMGWRGVLPGYWVRMTKSGPRYWTMRVFGSLDGGAAWRKNDCKANTKGKGSDDGRFIGTGVMNEAFLDRFPITMEQPYATPNTETKILGKAGCEKEFADHLVKWASVIRKSFYEGGVDEVISTRRLVDIVRAFGIFNSKEKAIALCLARFDDDTKQAFMDLYGKVDAEMHDLESGDESPTVSDSNNKCPF